MTSDTLKTTTGHDVEKCPALREFHDRFRQVGVCAPVTGDPATDDREDTPEIKLIQLFYTVVSWGNAPAWKIPE